MARDFNQTRNTNARLINKEVSFYGTRYALQDNADGYNKVDVVVPNSSTAVKLYLEGNDTLTSLGIPPNVNYLHENALATFPNLEDLYLFSPTLVDLSDDLTELGGLTNIYVPSDLLSNYKGIYTTIESNFDEITTDYVFVIEGSGELTSTIITNQLDPLSNEEKYVISKLVIDEAFDTNVDNVVWSYNFANYLPNLNNNIWYNGNKYDFTTRTLSGVDELLESDIANFIATIGNDKRSGVLELHFEGFSDMSVALDYDYSALPNLEYVWLDNVRYELLKAPNGYQLVDYIESTGTQYIDTEYTPNTNPNVELYFENEHKTSSQSGDRTVGGIIGNQQLKLPNYYGSNIENYFYSSFQTPAVYDQKIKYVISGKSGNQQFIYGNTITNRTATGTLDFGGLNIYLFAANRNNTSDRIFIGQVNYFIAKENGIPKLMMYGVKNLSTQKYAMYDFVSHTLCENKGTGDFLGGNVIPYIMNTLSPTYFYLLSNLETEYNANLNQTFYLDYNGTLPTFIYEVAYYSDINCTISILPENMQIGTRYYAKCQGIDTNVALVKGLGSENPSNVTFNIGSNFQDLLNDLSNGNNDVTDTYNNVFVEIPTIYRKVLNVVDNQITDFAVSTQQLDNTWKPYPCFVKPNGIDVMSYVRIGKYMFSSSSVASSVNASPINITIGNARTLARAISNEYQLIDWQIFKLLQDLGIIHYQRIDIVGVNSYLGINNWNKETFVDGVCSIKPKWIFAYDTTKYVDSPTENTDGYTLANYSFTNAGGIVKKLGYDSQHQFFNYVVETTSTSGTYYMSTCYPDNNNKPTWFFTISGIFTFATNANWTGALGCRLCYRPIGE